jgi:hypothetical protein
MLFSEKGKEQPLGEQGWPEMSYWDTTPVEHTFPDPTLLHGCPNVDERTSHPARFPKPSFPSQFPGGEAAGLRHEPCRLHARPFDAFRRPTLAGRKSRLSLVTF